MSTQKKYKIRCWVHGPQFVWGTSPPSKCPINSADSVQDYSISEADAETFIDENQVLRTETSSGFVSHFGATGQEIYISPDGMQAHYSSISQAVTENVTYGMTFIIHPGTYTEETIRLPSGCHLYSLGSANNTIISAANPDAPIIILGHNSTIRGVTITGATGPNGRAVVYNSDGSPGKITECHMINIINCTMGVEAYGFSDVPEYPNKFIATQIGVNATKVNAIRNAFYFHDGIDVAISNINIQATLDVIIDCGVRCFNEVKCNLVSLEIQDCKEGIHADVNCTIDSTTTICNTCDISICTSGGGNTVNCTNLISRNSIKHDAQILSDEETDVINLSNAQIDVYKIHNPNKNKITGLSFGDGYVSQHETITGDIRFGSKNLPTKVAIGEGKPYKQDMIVLSNNNLESGNWVDNTVFATSSDDSAFKIFQSTAVGNVMYLGSNYPIVGFKCRMHAEIRGVTHEDLAWEYWSSEGLWKAFAVMYSYSTEPFYTLDIPFLATSKKTQVRFGLHTKMDWSTKNIQGVERFWVRLRLARNIPNIPIAEEYKLHTSSIEFGKEGFSEFFGDSRKSEDLGSDCISFFPSPSNPPTSQNLYSSKSLVRINSNNRFVAMVDNTIHAAGTIPCDMDSSFPIKFILNFVGSTDGSGDVEWEVNWGYTIAGDVIHLDITSAPMKSVSEKNMTYISNISAGQMGICNSVQFLLNVEHCIPNPESGIPTDFWMSITRKGSSGADTYDGDISIVQMHSKYIIYQNGTHIYGYI